MNDGVWIENEDVLTPGGLDPDIVSLCETQILFVFEHSYLRKVPAYLIDRIIGRTVVGHDDLKTDGVRVIINGLQAVLQDLLVIPAEHHDREFESVRFAFEASVIDHCLCHRFHRNSFVRFDLFPSHHALSLSPVTETCSSALVRLPLDQLQLERCISVRFL